MAHKHKRKSHKHRRRMGAIGGGKSSNLIKLGSIAAGYLMADTINEQVDKVLPKTKNATTNVEEPNQWVGVGAELGIGGLLLMRKKGKYKQFTDIGGGILAGAGLKRALKKAGVISGYQAVPVIGKHRLAGYQKVPVIGGRPAQLQGTPAQLQGFRVNGYTSQGSGVMGAAGRLNTGSGYLSS